MTIARNIIVTGASSGIGEATCIELSALGHSVLATGRREDALSRLVASGGAAQSLVGDTTNSDFPSEAFSIATKNGAVSAVVISAGRGLTGTLLTSDPDAWRSLWNVNVLAPMNLMRHAVEYFFENTVELSSSTCDIVVVGSTVGREISAKNPVYGATKFALHSLVESLRREVSGAGIRVSLVEPGFVRSGFQSAANYDMEAFAELEDLQGPFLKPKDIARTIAFVINQPVGVHLDDVRIRPTRQTS